MLRGGGDRRGVQFPGGRGQIRPRGSPRPLVGHGNRSLRHVGSRLGTQLPTLRLGGRRRLRIWNRFSALRITFRAGRRLLGGQRCSRSDFVRARSLSRHGCIGQGNVRAWHGDGAIQSTLHGRCCARLRFGCLLSLASGQTGRRLGRGRGRFLIRAMTLDLGSCRLSLDVAGTCLQTGRRFLWSGRVRSRGGRRGRRRANLGDLATELRLLFAASRSRLLGLLLLDDIRPRRLLRFWDRCGLRLGRRRLRLDLPPLDHFRLGLGGFRFDRPFVIRFRLVISRHLNVFRDRYRLPSRSHFVAGQEDIENPVEDLQFDRRDEQDRVEQQSQHDSQLHTAAKDAVLDRRQGGGHPGDRKSRHNQPHQRVGIPARVVQPEIGQNRAQDKSAQHDQRNHDRPELVVKRLERPRFHFANNASNLRHVVNRLVLRS